MAASIVFRKISDKLLAANPHLLSPQTLYRGMVVAIEYHELYVKNQGSVLNNPTHRFDGNGTPNIQYMFTSRKVTGSAYNAAGQGGDDTGDDSATTFIAYGTPNWATIWGPTAIESTMAANTIYELWTTQRTYNTNTGLPTSGSYTFTHTIGGNEP